jgi:hypothetical protein
MRISQSDVYVEGETRTHADAEAVNRALIAAGMAMQEPQTEVLSSAGGGVSFILAGSPPGPQKEAVETPAVADGAPAPASEPADTAATQPASQPEEPQ